MIMALPSIFKSKKFALAAGLGVAGALALTAMKVFASSGVISKALPNKVVVIILENQSYDSSFPSHYPYLNSLISYMGFASKYFAITHPSLPNYIAMTAGSTLGVANDYCPNQKFSGTDQCSGVSASGTFPISTTHIGDIVPSWKLYAENYSTYTFPNCNDSTGLFAAKHVPFLYYADTTKPSVTSRIVDYADPNVGFFADVKNGVLPSLSFIIPNLCDDGHSPSLCSSGDQGTTPYYADTWMKNFFSQWLSAGVSSSGTSNPNGTYINTAIFVTFDEGSGCPPSGNQVYCLVYSPMSSSGVSSPVTYNHYNLLSTIEALVAGYKTLGRNDSRSSPMLDLFGPVSETGGTPSNPTSVQIGFMDPVSSVYNGSPQVRTPILYFVNPTNLTFGQPPGQTSFPDRSVWTFETSCIDDYNGCKKGAAWGVKASPNVMCTGKFYSAANGCGTRTQGIGDLQGDGDVGFEFILDEPYASNNTGDYFSGTSGGYLAPGNQGLDGVPTNLPILHCEIPWPLQAAYGGPVPCPQANWANKRALIVGDFFYDVQHPRDTPGLGYWAEMHAVRFIQFL
jgi:hypothetical protein